MVVKTSVKAKLPQSTLFPFTDFESVTPDTNLENLNLNWRERDLPQKERTKHVHSLHPYLGKFIPQLVEIFLRKYHPSRVIDPFLGSGTTAIEALCLGIESFGCDLSEFNALLSRVKTRKYDINRLEHEVLDILGRTTEIPQHLLLEEPALYVANQYLRTWYSDKALSALLHYRDLINDNYQYADVLRIILSRAARSARQTTHFDLDFPKVPQRDPYYCYKHSKICQPTTDAKRFLRQYSHDTIKRIRNFSYIRSDAAVEITCGDSREVEFPKSDLVITSPPYVGLIDYHEQHRSAYELLGLPWHEENEIGSAKRGNSERAQQQYLDQMSEVFQNVTKSLKKRARIVVVVHDRKQLYPELAKRLGFRPEYTFHRQVDRRTGRRAGDFYESVFVWKL